MRVPFTPLILTYNEAPNLRRTLQKLTWADRILVVDSFSADETLRIAREFPQVEVLQRRFDNLTNQWNFGVESCPPGWILSLDADYVLSEGLVAELQHWEPQPGVAAYFARFAYCVFGRPLRGSIYPPRAILFDSQRCHYYQDGHTQLLRIEGPSGWLDNIVFHDDRKSLGSWLANQDRYTAQEIEKLTHARGRLSIQDRIRRHIVFAPGLVFFYTLFGKGLIFDGWEGWYYAFQRTLVELLISLRLLEARWPLTSSAPEPGLPNRRESLHPSNRARV
jgi:glycosyltransferase involved in cell wall biosynthesis